MSNSSKQRPLSPHLSVYRWQWTMSYSILHRMTGVALSIGSLYIAAWLIALATHSKVFYMLHSAMMHPLGVLVMLGFCFSLYYHLLNGIRHLYWDTGRGLTLESGRLSGHLVAITAVVLTALSGFVLI